MRQDGKTTSCCDSKVPARKAEREFACGNGNSPVQENEPAHPGLAALGGFCEKERGRRVCIPQNGRMESIEINELGGWFEQEADALVLYARQWLDPHAAEDAVQDAFIDLMNCRRQPDQPKPWLYQAVRYRAMKLLRTSRRRSRREALAAGEPEPCLEGRSVEMLDAREASRALAGLNPQEREVITLRIWGGLKFEEIAAVTESSVATVFRRYRAGLDELGNLLEPSCMTCRH